MAALAFCIDTAQQKDLSGAKIVTIITNNQGEHVIIPPCDNTNSWGEVVSITLGRDLLAASRSSSRMIARPKYADDDCRIRRSGVATSSRRR
jgi:hypothetical protein